MNLTLYIPYREYLTYGDFLKKTIYKDKFSLKWNYTALQWSSSTTTIDYKLNSDNSRTHTVTTSDQTLIDTLTQFITLAKLPTSPPLSLHPPIPLIPINTLITQTISHEQTIYPSIPLPILTYFITNRITEANIHPIYHTSPNHIPPNSQL